MPTPPAGFAQVTVHYDTLGQGTDDAQVVFGIEAAGYDQDLADAIDGIVKAALKQCLVSDAAIDHITLRDGDGNVFETSAAAVAGLQGAPSSAPQVAYLAKKLTASGGRRNKGRMYFPGTAESRVNGDGTVTSGGVSEISDATTDLFENLGLADVGMVILHSDGGTPTPITGFAAESVVATQRRRLKR